MNFKRGIAPDFRGASWSEDECHEDAKANLRDDSSLPHEMGASSDYACCEGWDETENLKAQSLRGRLLKHKAPA